VRARLRHLGARRLQLTADATGQVNQVRDLPGMRLADGPDRVRQPIPVVDVVRGAGRDERRVCGWKPDL
jgi:hypothetical protein